MCCDEQVSKAPFAVKKAKASKGLGEEAVELAGQLIKKWKKVAHASAEPTERPASSTTASTTTGVGNAAATLLSPAGSSGVRKAER